MNLDGDKLYMKIVSFRLDLQFCSSKFFHLKSSSYSNNQYTIQIWRLQTKIWIVYRLFDYENDFKSKNFELQSCRSRRKLQFSYKVYLHSSFKKIQFFEKKTGLLLPCPTAGATVPRRSYRSGRIIYFCKINVKKM
jgi:hypothetical protein